MTDWFEEWFGEEYLRLYPHRNEADARRMVDLLLRHVPWKAGWRVLDVGCGAGRHAAALERAGCRPVGLDLSARLLARAREVTGALLVRADMRALPIRDASMDITVNLFTSFGYFLDDDVHQAALAGMARTIRPGGWFAIDFLHAPHVRAHLVPEDTLPLGDRVATVRRRVSEDDRFVLKTIRTPEGREFLERVRLLTPAELEDMVRHAGIEVRQRFGDYDGSALGDDSRRTILIGQRA